ncbi:hypothetical protein H3H37_19525 [Duganella sp. LX20W]|uniref:Uncharacterized protein n=1 Tax=Rugamonas brunnea TaxID=2758569 RepID=A0A7W2IDC2_9BURK|nr:hypothetical protein [Rugamonas brunnea]MBA5639254.1 hypothetical protein [Rugamonas brunnea]
MTTQPTFSPSDDISAWRSQFRLTHTFHVLLGTSEPVAGALEALLKRAGARIEKWVIVRRAGCYEHCIIVEGIDDEAARALRKEFAGLTGQIKVHVEHMLHLDGGVARH